MYPLGEDIKKIKFRL